MPGGPCHLLFGFITGTGLHIVLDSNFTPPFILIFGISNFLGPDLGTWGNWFVDNVSDMPKPILILMEHLHSIEGYVFVFSFPLAVAFTQISKKVLPRHYKVPSLQDAWELVVAGGLSHFFLETLFEENGNTELYRLIISTGSFESNEIPPLTIVLVGSVCVLVVYIFLKGFARNEKNTNHQAQIVMRNLLRLSLVYILYCAVSKFMFSRSPVGEEADLGVMLFLGVFHFLPIYLCFRCAARHRRGVIHDNEQQHEQSALYGCLETGSSMLPKSFHESQQKEFIFLVILNVLAFSILIYTQSPLFSAAAVV